MITLTEFREVGNIVGVEYITKEWVIGGKEGGSCWGTEQYNNITPEEEPDFEALDTVLEKVSPNISHLLYKRLLRELIEKDRYTNRDYYGNYSIYAIHKINVDKLYEFLKDNNLLPINNLKSPYHLQIGNIRDAF